MLGVAVGKMWDTSVGRWVSRLVVLESLWLGLVLATVISLLVNPRTLHPQFTRCHTRIPAF